MTKKIMIFIDGSNFYHSLQSNFHKTNMDFEHFCNFLIKEDLLVKIFYYNSPVYQSDNPEAYKKQQSFFAYLNKVKRLELFLGRLEKRDNNHKAEKGVDVKLAIDMLSNAYNNNYDVAILISNDADFVPAIKEVQTLGKSVYNVAFPKSKSYHLSQICDKTIYIDDINAFLKQ